MGTVLKGRNFRKVGSHCHSGKPGQSSERGNNFSDLQQQQQVHLTYLCRGGYKTRGATLVRPAGSSVCLALPCLSLPAEARVGSAPTAF